MVPQHVHAQVATNVDVYILPTTLPDTIHPEFGTARDNWLTAIIMAIKPTTGSRVGDVTAIEVRDVFEVPDVCVSTTAGTNLWRGVFNPPAPYTTMTGSREYATGAFVPKGGQMNLSGVSQRTLCDRVQLLNNQSAFTTNTYSVSRIGVFKGSDGKLGTADDIFLRNGEAGTILVDMIVLIGSRLGASANSQININDLNTAVTTNGAIATFEYYFNGVLMGSANTMLYQSGGIPDNTNHVVLFWMPAGALFSLVGPPGSTPFLYKWTRDVDPQFATWTTANAAATEGSSAFVKYDIKERAYVNAPNGRITVFKVNRPAQVATASSLTVDIPWAKDDLDQDR